MLIYKYIYCIYIYTVYSVIILHYKLLYPLSYFFNSSSSTLCDVSGGGTPVDIRISQQQSGTGARPSFDDICKGCLGTSHMMQHMHSQFFAARLSVSFGVQFPRKRTHGDTQWIAMEQNVFWMF